MPQAAAASAVAASTPARGLPAGSNASTRQRSPAV